MTKTRDKLNEAKFFLNFMKQTQDGPDTRTQAGLDEFRYFMNAFLSAFRSITKLPHKRNVKEKNYQYHDYVLEKEFGKADGFNEWYQEKYEELKADPKLEFLKQQRDIVIHFKDKKSVELHGRSASALDIFYYIVADETTPVEPVSIPEVPQEKPRAVIRLFTELSPDISPTNEVVTVCAACLAEVEKIVDECESKFLVK